MRPIYAKGRSTSTFRAISNMTASIVRIASRGSPLALTQARLAREALARAHGWNENTLDELCPILTFTTGGDRIQDRTRAEAGGKGLFVKEIEDALIEGEADIAVHSMKDMPGVQPAGLHLAAIVKREDPRDVFVGRNGSFADLPRGAKIGTSSVRRKAQALRRRPDLEAVPLRGNVETRLAKLTRGEADGTFLARAGLTRLNIEPAGAEILDPEDWLPALGQGAIGIEIRSQDGHAAALVAPIDDPVSHLALSCERGFLAALDGSCRTPLAGLAELAGGKLHFRGEVLSLDGQNCWTVSRQMPAGATIDDAVTRLAYAMGEDAARDVRAQAGAQFPRF